MKSTRSSIFIVILAIINAIHTSSVVVTSDGAIEGLDLTYNGINYKSYQGIRYAQPPTGNLRFKPPEPVAPWSGVADGTKPGAPCPQAEGAFSFTQMSEDCLFLNVYTPSDSSESSVLFWIHGGEFNSMSGNDDTLGPQFLMERGIILVTVNYRLGALGFLSLDIDGATGNSGLKDVALALQWTKRNIVYFGGDPSAITIGGNSAGAVIAHYMMLTTKTKGLFKRTILHSGSALGFRFFNRDPVSNALALGKHLGIIAEDKVSLLEQLMNVTPYDIINATNAMGQLDDRKGFRPFTPFIPNAEIESPHAFITEEPLSIIKEGLPQNYPVLAGFNEDEGIKMLKPIKDNPSLIEQLNEKFERCVPTDIEYSEGSVKSIKLAQKINQFYFNNETINDDNMDKFVELITDTQFSHSIDFWIRIHKNNDGSNDVFYYKFKYDGELNWFKIRNNLTYPGTAHGDDMGYLFHTDNTAPIIQSITNTTRQMLNNMVLTTANFVKFGNPTPDASLDFNVAWEPTRMGHTNYLQLEPTIHNSEEPPIRARTLFWEKIYEEYYGR